MKNLFTIIALLISLQNINAQIQWTTPESTPDMQANMFVNMGVDDAGTVYTINETQSNISFYVMYRFFAYNTNGEKIWEFANDSCFTDCIEKYHCVLPINGDGALFIGYREDLTTTNHLLFKRFNAAGQLLWVKDWVTPWASVNPVQAKWDNNGNAVISVQAYSINPSETAIGFVKLDTATHNIIQQSVDVQNTDAENSCSDFEMGKNNLIYGCGNGMGNAYVFKLDSSGNFTKTFLPDDQLGFASYNNISLDANDNVIAIGYSGDKAILAKYNSSLSQQWITALQEDTLATSGVDVVTDNDDNIYALCNFSQSRLDTNSFSGFSFDNSDYFVQKISSGGSTIWMYKYLEDLDSAVVQNSAAPIGGAIQMILCGDKIEIASNDQIDTLTGWKFIKNTIDLNGNSTQRFIVNADLMNEWLFVNGYAKRSFMLGDQQCNIYTSFSTIDSGGLPYKDFTRKFGSTSTGIFNTMPSNLNAQILQTENQLEILLEKNTKANISLYDISGRLLWREKSTGMRTVIPTSRFAKGMYVLHINNQDGQKNQKIALR